MCGYDFVNQISFKGKPLEFPGIFVDPFENAICSAKENSSEALEMHRAFRKFEALSVNRVCEVVSTNVA